MLTTWLPVDEGTNVWGLIPAALDRLKVLYAGLWDAGVDKETLEACRQRIATMVGIEAGDARALTDAQRAAVDFAEQYTLDAHGVTDAQCERLNEYFTPAQLSTLTTAVAVFDAMARVQAALTLDGGVRVEVDLP